MDGEVFDVQIMDGTAWSDPPYFADKVNDAAARGDVIAVTPTGPFRSGLDGDPLTQVEFAAGVLAGFGFHVVETDPPRRPYDVPPGAVA